MQLATYNYPIFKIPGIGTKLYPVVSSVEGSSFLDIPRLASVDVREFTTSLTNAGTSPLVKGVLTPKSTAGLLPLPDVDGCMTGVDTLDVVLLVLGGPGVAAVDLRFLFFWWHRSNRHLALSISASIIQFAVRIVRQLEIRYEESNFLTRFVDFS